MTTNGNNILIIGPQDSGKKTTMKNMNINDSNIKIATYASVIIENQKKYLFISKGEENFKSFNELVSSFKNGRPVDGIIIILDNSKGFRENDLKIVEKIISKKIPHIIFSNKQDISTKSLNIHFKDSLIVPTIATEGIGLDDGFRLLNMSMDHDEEKIIEKSEKDNNPTLKTGVIDGSDDYELIEKMKDAMKPSDNHDLCELKISMHLIKLEKTIQTLEKHGFSNMTVIETKFSDETDDSKQIYRNFAYKDGMKTRYEIVMIIKKEDVIYVLNAIRSIISDDIDDIIRISSVDNIIRVRTSERGEKAID